jgi:hypothetical protein
MEVFKKAAIEMARSFFIIIVSTFFRGKKNLNFVSEGIEVKEKNVINVYRSQQERENIR